MREENILLAYVDDVFLLFFSGLEEWLRAASLAFPTKYVAVCYKQVFSLLNRERKRVPSTIDPSHDRYF